MTSTRKSTKATINLNETSAAESSGNQLPLLKVTTDEEHDEDMQETTESERQPAHTEGVGKITKTFGTLDVKGPSISIDSMKSSIDRLLAVEETTDNQIASMIIQIEQMMHDPAITSLLAEEQVYARTRLRAQCDQALQQLQNDLASTKARRVALQGILDRKTPKEEIIYFYTDVAPVINNRKHRALVRIFNFKSIPVIDTKSKEVDFGRVTVKSFSNPPILKVQIRNLDKVKRPLAIVKGVVDFLAYFRSFYLLRLSEDLFDDIAWRFMPDSITEKDLSDKFDRVIAKHEMSDRGWAVIQAALMEVFHFHDLKVEILVQLFAIQPMQGDNVYTYTDRIRKLYVAAQPKDVDQSLILVIIRTLPDAEREKIAAQYPLYQGLESIEELLEFMCKNITMLTGSRSDPCDWFTEMLSKTSSAVSSTNNSPAHQGSGYQRSSNLGRNRSNRSNRSHSKEHRTNMAPYQKGAPPRKEVKFDTQTRVPCTDPKCIKLGYKHDDSRCYRHHDPKKIESITTLKGKQQKRSGKKSYQSSYGAQKTVAAIR
ncbi:hypothetical protein BGZ76_003763 [Entomortierella beljakovae]|nr:hypothetical protein BGZ76_003763 [Entomortierella beljakovae]